MSSLGRSAVMKALTVTDTSSGSWVSDRAVWTTCRDKDGGQEDAGQRAEVSVRRGCQAHGDRPSLQTPAAPSRWASRPVTWSMRGLR